ncbi:CapA family protein [Phytoactinopolyspora limicola]|uniref:CapA family protein n=1 Tax=Phytoactinopolyspora limicola TaxID=2715536 RepID=UPI001A9C7B7F|nr:CapA family protein [Phytoactinopolyspora limicola]
MGDRHLLMFFCGDVMMGRGVDQILPNAGDPQLMEPFMRDARAYVDLAEKVSGPIQAPVAFEWPWGDVLPLLDGLAPHLRVMNLETTITRSATFDPNKSVHYRMSPGNVAALAAARPDVCVLANNHVLDFGQAGLVETLDVLDRAGLATVGAGLDLDSATRPSVLTTRAGGRVAVLSFGARSSGIPPDWRAGPGRPGVVTGDLRGSAAAALIDRIASVKRAGMVVVVSVHWGGNWGYDVPAEQTDFARRMIDAGADVVHGHSSHHPRPVGVYRGRMILYGCGDLINDYEGISGHEEYRDELRLLYLARIEASTGALVRLWMLPMRSRRMRLERAAGADIAWLASKLDEVSADHGAGVAISTVRAPGGPMPALVLV